jgi:3-methyladenine DNA glycosylase Tag
MQATGIVNDHLETCIVRGAVEADIVAARTLP